MFERDKLGEIVDGHTLRFVRVVHHSCERVWRAITDETELAHWMGYPVRFEPRVDGRVYFFGEDERIEGKVFIFDPPRTLAYSFADVRVAEHMARAERDWTVRWDLDPIGNDGCRITFIQRWLGGAQLWGLGEGWHGFIEQLVAYFDGTLEQRWDEFRSYGSDDIEGLRLYRSHVTNELVAWARAVAADARRAMDDDRRDDVRANIDRLELAARQLGRIAEQEGARPDYGLHQDVHVEAP